MKYNFQVLYLSGLGEQEELWKKKSCGMSKQQYEALREGTTKRETTEIQALSLLKPLVKMGANSMVLHGMIGKKIKQIYNHVARVATAVSCVRAIQNICVDTEDTGLLYAIMSDIDIKDEKFNNQEYERRTEHYKIHYDNSALRGKCTEKYITGPFNLHAEEVELVREHILPWYRDSITFMNEIDL